MAQAEIQHCGACLKSRFLENMQVHTATGVLNNSNECKASQIHTCKKLNKSGGLKQKLKRIALMRHLSSEGVRRNVPMCTCLMGSSWFKNGWLEPDFLASDKLKIVPAPNAQVFVTEFLDAVDTQVLKFCERSGQNIYALRNEVCCAASFGGRLATKESFEGGGAKTSASNE